MVHEEPSVADPAAPHQRAVPEPDHVVFYRLLQGAVDVVTDVTYRRGSTLEVLTRPACGYTFLTL